MTHSKLPFHSQQSERRSYIERRWIKSSYQGEERRSGKDRRAKFENKGQINRGLPVPEDSDTKELVGFEKLLVSYTIQLEAVTRLLLDKGILDKNELLATMKMVQTEYQHPKKS